MKIGIIVSEFNGEITSRMLLAAREKAQSLKITISATNHVPGAYDIPIIADALLQRSDVDAVIDARGHNTRQDKAMKFIMLCLAVYYGPERDNRIYIASLK